MVYVCVCCQHTVICPGLQVARLIYLYLLVAVLLFSYVYITFSMTRSCVVHTFMNDVMMDMKHKCII